MKVLFVSTGGLGHVHPMVPLAVAFGRRGDTVRWATSADAVGRVGSAGIDAVVVGRRFDDVQAEFLRRYPEARGIPPAAKGDHAFPRLFGEISVEFMLDDTLAAARAFGPDLVIQEPGALVGPLVAAILGVPSVTHSFGSLLPKVRVQGAAERVAPHWRAAGLEPRPYGGAYDGWYLDLYPPSFQGPADHVPRRRSLRPVPFDEATGDEATVWPDSTDRRPLVYLTMGTVRRDTTVLRAAIQAIAPLDVRLLVTVGPGGDPTAFGRQPANVRIERYVPQTRVFREAVAVASHGGAGTFLAALSAGLPQLILPQAADQFLNADAGVRSGAALSLAPDAATPDAIADAVHRLLAEPAFRSRATDVSAEIAVMPSPDEIATFLASG